MPRKIKVVWVICCILIFFGFVVLANKREMDASREKRRTEAEDTQKRNEVAKQRLEQKKQFEAMMGKVQELIALKQYEEAAETASEALKLDPKNARAHTWWGLALARAGRIDEALDKFNLSSQLDPNQTQNYYYWGLVLIMKGDNEHAVDKFENALLLDPENSKVYASWGAALNNLERYDEAIKKLEEALAHNPKNENAYGVLVDAHFHKGQYQQAWEVIDRARKNQMEISPASLKRLSDASPEPR